MANHSWRRIRRLGDIFGLGLETQPARFRAGRTFRGYFPVGGDLGKTDLVAGLLSVSRSGCTRQSIPIILASRPHRARGRR